MISPAEQKAVFALLVHAALADGTKSDAERAALRRMAEAFRPEAVNPWVIYQEVLAGSYPLEQAARELTGPESRLLAYEMALGVCDSDGLPNASEQAFLTQLREALGMPNQAAAAGAAEQAAQQVAATVPTAVASAPVASAPVASAAAASAPADRLSPVDRAALDKQVLQYATLAGALELLPQSLATMAVVPLQMKLVYGIGKSHGYALDRGHITEFMGTAGAGVAAQTVEGYARKLLGGLMGGVLGKGMIGSLGRTAATTGAGAAITFAATYAIGQLAITYYGRGRKMEMTVLKDTYARLMEEGRSQFGQHRLEVEQRASTLSPSEIINLVRQQP